MKKTAIVLIFAVALTFAVAVLEARGLPAHLAFFVTAARLSAHPLLGSGWGVDHVAVAVQNVEQAQHDYQQVLGFTPLGQRDTARYVFFQNFTYFELGLASVAPFTAKHEGGIYLGVNVSSAKDAVDYLKAQKFDISEPVPGGSSTGPGETTPGSPTFYTLSTPRKPPSKGEVFSLPIFFCEYLSDSMKRKEENRVNGLTTHPNTALRIHSVWFAVHDVNAQLRNLMHAGFQPGQKRKTKLLDASGREVEVGKGSIVVLRPDGTSGALNAFLGRGEEGIIAVSVEVADFKKAHGWIEEHSGQKLDEYKGFYGRSFMVPPELTHGIWMEFFQQ